MTEKRFTHKKWYDERQLFDGEEAFAIVDSGIQASILCNKLNKLSDENEQLERDNNVLIQLLKNQSIIIQELSSKIFEYQLKEPITLTKEDMEIMGKAVSYYTHGRYGE